MHCYSMWLYTHTDVICNISTISKHLLEKSEAIWCISCLQLFWKCDRTAYKHPLSHSYHQPSLGRMWSAPGKVTPPTAALAPSPNRTLLEKNSSTWLAQRVVCQLWCQVIWVETPSRSAGAAWVNIWAGFGHPCCMPTLVWLELYH